MTTPFEQGADEFEKGNYQVAFRLFERAAQLGEKHAWLNLGFCYDEGFGTEKNRGLALHYYRQYAAAGATAGMENIALVYLRDGNIALAKAWYACAVVMGSGDAALELAKLLAKYRSRSKMLLKKAVRSSFITREAREEAEEALCVKGRRRR